MSPTLENGYLVLLAIVVAGVGTVDTLLARHWDGLAVFVLLDVILLFLLTRLGGRRPPVPLRSDLVSWLRRRAAVHGEPLEALADRAVASYRERLEPLGEPRD